MVAVIALAFTACKKKENDAKVLKFNGATEQLVVVNDEPDGRMYIDANNFVQFDNGDEVAVFNCPDASGANSNYTIYTITGNGAYWTGNDSNIDYDGVFYAYYPGGSEYVTPMLSNGNRVKFTLMPTQEYRVDDVTGRPLVPQNALYMASKAEGTTLGTAYFDFKNICGVLAMNLYGTDTSRKVMSIELEDPAINIVGEVTMKIDEVDPVEMTSLLNNYNYTNPYYVSWLNNYKDRIDYYISGTNEHPVSHTMTLDCTTNFPNGVQLGTTEADATTFYFVLRPLALKNGCNMTVYFSDGTKKYLNTTIGHMMHPNYIMKMKPVCVDGVN
jgi:hypothetical protein